MVGVVAAWEREAGEGAQDHHEGLGLLLDVAGEASNKCHQVVDVLLMANSEFVVSQSRHASPRC